MAISRFVWFFLPDREAALLCPGIPDCDSGWFVLFVASWPNYVTQPLVQGGGANAHDAQREGLGCFCRFFYTASCRKDVGCKSITVWASNQTPDWSFDSFSGGAFGLVSTRPSPPPPDFPILFPLFSSAAANTGANVNIASQLFVKVQPS